MKLFELFEKDTQSGLNNLKAIVEAAKAAKPARVKLGESTIQINSTTAKCIYDLYEQARTTNKLDKFMEQLSSPTAAIMENAETLAHILVRFPKEVKDFEMGGDLDDNLYDALFDYYSMHGEMPYGVAKARDGDPYEWVTQRLDNELDMDPATSVEDQFGLGEDAFGPDGEDVPELISNGMFESKKARKDKEQVGEGWDEMIAASKKRAADERGTGKFDKKKISTGTVYTRKYDDKSGETEEPTKAADGGEIEKRGRGRPRTRPEPDANAEKRGRGRPRKNPLPDANAEKRGRGRPKKVREWVENLRYIVDGK